jgi:sortase B
MVEKARHKHMRKDDATGIGMPSSDQADAPTFDVLSADEGAVAGMSAAHGTGRGKDEKDRGKKAGKKKGNLLSNILIVVGVVLLLVAGGMWGFAQWRYHQQDVQNKKLAAYATIPDDGKKAPTVDWEGLKAINPDVVGWIQVPGTVINYPVYQGADNDRYLRHTAEGEYSVGGQIFLDYENTKPGMVDHQSILYGHHLKDGSMFYPLFLLKDQETFDATDTIWYVTEQNDYELEPLFVYFTDPEDMDVRTFKFSSDADFHKYLTDRLGRAVSRRTDADRIIAGVKHVLTMSTCNYYEGYGRSILVSVPKDEATAALAGTATTTAATNATAGANAAATGESAETSAEVPAETTEATE